MELMNVLLAQKMVKPFIILSSVAFTCLAVPPLQNYDNELNGSKFSPIGIDGRRSQWDDWWDDWYSDGSSAESEGTTEYNVRYDVDFDPESHPNWRLLAPKDKCGATYGQRIIGGSEVDLGSYPWTAIIAYESFEKSYWSAAPRVRLFFGCGATLISEFYVLTAAHCARTPSEIKFVRFGEHNQLTNPDCEVRGGIQVCAPPVQDISVTQVLAHEDYNHDENMKNDVALLKLESPPVLNPFVQPACLPFREGMRMNYENKETTVAGWGLTENNRKSNILLAVTQEVFDSKTCRRIYREDNALDINYNDGQMCVGGRIGRDSCNGDSGGPLMYTGTFDPEIGARTYVIGLVSMGPTECGIYEIPGIYSRTPFFMEWILDHIGE